MFLIAIDKAGRLLVRQSRQRENVTENCYSRLPSALDNSSQTEILAWLRQLGVVDHSTIRNFEIVANTSDSPIKYSICCVDQTEVLGEDFEFETLESLWKRKIGSELAVAVNWIIRQIEEIMPGSANHLEALLLREHNLEKLTSRVFFTRDETVSVNEALISLLGAFAVANGQKTARLCMHRSQSELIQEMLMIHAEKISTGPLRQDRDSSVSYHMIRGGLEITLHHGGVIGDKTYRVEHAINQPSVNSSLRVPARIWRTIRTLTDSAVFIEVQGGPFSDSDTQWAEGAN